MRTILATLHSKFIHNSLALPCLAAYCGDTCGELLIREFTVHEPREAILAMLLAEQPDVVAFSVYLWNRRETLDLIDALAVAQPGLRLVVGGPEVSFEGPALFARHPGLTAVVRGEGEEPLRALLSAWTTGKQPGEISRLTLRRDEEIASGPDGPPLARLDDIPSPFENGLIDCERGFVYYETSRGCPFRCSFCLSANDDRVRSYSMARIESDLRWLLERGVPKIKLVDRTFNYDAARAREIFTFILAHNRTSHLHFEIAAHLLDAPTFTLLEQVPAGMFQFEIGVQSTLQQTLTAIDRRVCLDALAESVRRLRRAGRITLHLDLVAGLPGEGYSDFLTSIDRVAALAPHHLQIEPVKLLPGTPLRRQAARHAIRFDPNPPYTILGSSDLDFGELQRIRETSRLLDLIWNSGNMQTFVQVLAEGFGSLAKGLEHLANYWRQHDLFRFPSSRQALFEQCGRFATRQDEAWHGRLRDALAYDYARCERVVLSRLPEFFDVNLELAEQAWVRRQVEARTEAIRGAGIKLQHFAAVFHHLPDHPERTVRLFCYLTETGRGMTVEEFVCPQLSTTGTITGSDPHG
ncbi:MAG: DUF4080 domain-containing protein [Desulfuromonadales bacterium]|nr:DUF4080 domain-containing protein [Desulfuromonadales bacterium]